MKSKEDILEKLSWVGYALVILFVFWWLIVGSERGHKWSGGGEINAFPTNSEAKNYRLEATITGEVKAKDFFNYTEYTPESATWPNGGTLELKDCKIPKGETKSCTSQDGRSYYIEIQTPPADDTSATN